MQRKKTAAEYRIEKALLDEEYRNDHTVIIDAIKKSIKEQNFEEAQSFIDKYRSVALDDPAFDVLEDAVSDKLADERQIIRIKTRYDITDRTDTAERLRLCRQALKLSPRNEFFRHELETLAPAAGQNGTPYYHEQTYPPQPMTTGSPCMTGSSAGYVTHALNEQIDTPKSRLSTSKKSIILSVLILIYAILCFAMPKTPFLGIYITIALVQLAIHGAILFSKLLRNFGLAHQLIINISVLSLYIFIILPALT